MSTKYTITVDEDGYHLAQENDESTWPTTTKKTAREIVARLSQLLEIGPVAPQTEPEIICIGTIEVDPDE